MPLLKPKDELKLANFRVKLALQEAENTKAEHLYHILETKIVIIDVKTLRLLHEFCNKHIEIECEY